MGRTLKKIGMTGTLKERMKSTSTIESNIAVLVGNRILRSNPTKKKINVLSWNMVVTTLPPACTNGLHNA